MTSVLGFVENRVDPTKSSPRFFVNLCLAWRNRQQTFSEDTQHSTKEAGRMPTAMNMLSWIGTKAGGNANSSSDGDSAPPIVSDFGTYVTLLQTSIRPGIPHWTHGTGDDDDTGSQKLVFIDGGYAPDHVVEDSPFVTSHEWHDGVTQQFHKTIKSQVCENPKWANGDDWIFPTEFYMLADASLGRQISTHAHNVDLFIAKNSNGWNTANADHEAGVSKRKINRAILWMQILFVCRPEAIKPAEVQTESFYLYLHRLKPFEKEGPFYRVSDPTL